MDIGKKVVIKSLEDEVEFVIECVVVEPTREEKKMRWGRECLTAEEHVEYYPVADFFWAETVAVVESPLENSVPDSNVEDEGFGPLFQELAEPISKLGARFCVMHRKNGSWFIDEGDVSCEVAVRE